MVSYWPNGEPLDPTAEPGVAARLRRLQRARRRATLLLIGYLPGVGLSYFLIHRVLPSPVVMPVLAVLWIVALMVHSIRVAFERCPRCGYPDLSAKRLRGGVVDRCPRCDLDLTQRVPTARGPAPVT